MVVLEEQVIKSNGDLAVKLYERGRVLGQGKFATVYELKCADSVVAGKLIQKDKVTDQLTFLKIASEVRIHRSLQHPNIVQFEHFFETPEYFVLITELCPNRTLRELLCRRTRLDEVEAKCLVYQLLKAVNYLHSKDVVHRDLKPSNIYLDANMQVKLGDFGLAAQLNFATERKRTRCGTPMCSAPEALDPAQGHGREVDVWAVAVLAYMLVSGKSPFTAETISEVHENIRTISYTFTADHSALLRDFIQAVFVKDPTKRSTASELMNHPWFTCQSFPARLPLSSLAVPPRPVSLKSLPWVTITASSTPAKRSELRLKQRKRETSVFRSSKQLVFVQKWVDCSKEYGLAYVLSNGQVGLRFNDSTKIVTTGSAGSFEYFSQTAQEGIEESFSAYSKTAKKKVVLLEHFCKCLNKEGPSVSTKPSVFVEVWMSTPEFCLFRLNTNLVQAKFSDQTEFIVAPGGKRVTFVDKLGDQYRCPLADIAKYPKLARRMQYIKEVFRSRKKLA